MLKTARVDSGASGVTAAEWRTRVELAACYRLTALFGWDQVIYNHISARVPDEPDAFPVNPFGLLFDEIKASNLVKVRSDGSLVGGQRHGVNEDGCYGVNAAGFFLHSVVHEARPDLNCVMHFHSIETVAVANPTRSVLPRLKR
jgi:ribulose-5-phosphate 4-epimerase/fuculose-1-phosphate aldolase